MSEHFPPDIGSRQAQSRLRLRFLAVLNEMHTRVFDELRALWGDFKPTYEAGEQTGSESTSDNGQSETSDWTERIPTGFLDWYYDGIENRNSAVEKLNQRLDEWAERFNLHCPWIIEAALSTIATWERVPEAEKKRAWFWHPAGIWTPLAEGQQEFTFADYWDPLVESPTDAKARIRQNMDTRFDKWFKATEAVAKESGYEPPPISKREEDYLRWFIRYQVLDESPEAILRDATGVKNKQGISLAVHRMAKRIGLTIRAGKAGPSPAA